jgi:hypothetical protein
MARTRPLSAGRAGFALPPVEVPRSSVRSSTEGKPNNPKHEHDHGRYPEKMDGKPQPKEQKDQ